MKHIEIFSFKDQPTRQEWDLLPRVTFIRKNDIRAMGFGWLIWGFGIAWEGKELRK